MKKYMQPAVCVFEAEPVTVIATSIGTDATKKADANYEGGGDTKGERQGFWDSDVNPW